MTDKELKDLLAVAKWRPFYTYESGEEEFTGPSDSDTPNLAAVRSLVDASMAAERERCALIVEQHNPGGSYHIRTALAAAIRKA